MALAYSRLRAKILAGSGHGPGGVDLEPSYGSDDNEAWRHDIAREQELEPTAEAVAVDSGDDRLWDQRAHEPAKRLREGILAASIRGPIDRHVRYRAFSAIQDVFVGRSRYVWRMSKMSSRGENGIA